MADREFEINVRVSGDSGDFQRDLAGVTGTVKTFKNELKDLNKGLAVTRDELSGAADNLHKVSVQSGFASRALGSLTRFTREARDQMKDLNTSLKESMGSLVALDKSTADLASAQTELASRIRGVVVPAFNSELRVLDALQRRMIMTGVVTNQLARDQREAAIAAEAEARAIADLGDEADVAAAKLALLSMAQGRAGRSAITGSAGATASRLLPGASSGVDPGGLLYHRGIGGRLPWWMGGAALGTLGAGGLLPMAGLGPERLITTPLAIGASAIPALGGAASIGLGALGTAAVGGGSDAAVMKSTIADTKTLFTAYENLTKAQEIYGKGSKQAAQAQAELNYQLKALGPASGAELGLAKSVVKLNTLFDQVTAKARGSAVSILDQVVHLGHDYVGKVASAAAQNLAIINKDIKPLFAWLQGPQGMSIWNNLEAKFKQDLPIAVHAFTQAVELLLRWVNLSSKYVGGFLKSIDEHLTKWNSMSDLKLSTIIKHLVDDFRIWWSFIKAAGKALYDLFHNAAGEGFAVLQLFTKWLDKFDKWATSVKGSNWLHTFFKNRKDELIALIKFLGTFIAGWGKLYVAIQPLVPVFTTILRVLNSVFHTLTQISPALSTAIAGYIMFGKYLGYGKLNAGIGKVAGIGGGSAAATRAEVSALAGAGAKAATGRGAVAAEDIMGKSFGTAVEAGMAGGMLGFAGKIPGLWGKVGPLIKTGLVFWVGTGLLTGMAEGFSSQGSFFTKFGNGIQDTLKAVFGRSLGKSLAGAIGGGTIFPDLAGEVGKSAANIKKGVVDALQSIAHDSSWAQVNSKVSEMNVVFKSFGANGVAALKFFQNQIKQFEDSVRGLRQVTPAQASKIIGAFQNIKNEGGSAIQNLEATVKSNMTNIANDIGTHSIQGKQAIQLNFRAAANYMAQNFHSMGVSTSKAQAFIVSMLGKAATGGSANVSALVNNMTGAERKMIVNTKGGMTILLGIVNKALTALKQPNIAAGSIGAAAIGSLGSYVPTHAPVTSFPTGAGSPVFGHAAQGMLMQVGKPGERGRDSIPMSVGGHNIVVGAGEQVAVFNHQQQQVVNSRFSDMGGLGGMFQKYNRPHYMSQGGTPGGWRNVMASAESLGGLGYQSNPISPYGYSELGVPPTDANVGTALGSLPYQTHMRIRSGGHEVVAAKQDIGKGSSFNPVMGLYPGTVAQLGLSGGQFSVSIERADGVPLTLGAGALAQIANIIAPKIKGGGEFGSVEQGVLNMVADAANKRIKALTPVVPTGSYGGIGATGAGYAVPGGTTPHDAFSALSPGRVDQGFDFGGTGWVKAPLPGTVIEDQEWPGWPGVGGMVLATSHGNFYIMEDFAPSVTKGMTVKAGQAIGFANDATGSGIEVGWAAPGGYPLTPLTPYNGAADGTPMPGGYAVKSFLGYEMGGILQAQMMKSGGYPHKGHIKPDRTTGTGRHPLHRWHKTPTTSHHVHTHLPSVRDIPPLAGINPGFGFKFNSEAFIEPVVKGWMPTRPADIPDGVTGVLVFPDGTLVDSVTGEMLHPDHQHGGGLHRAPNDHLGGGKLHHWDSTPDGLKGGSLRHHKQVDDIIKGGNLGSGWDGMHGGLVVGGSGHHQGAGASTDWYLTDPPLRPYHKGSGGMPQALSDAQSFMTLLGEELSLVKDTDDKTGAPLMHKGYAYGKGYFFPGDPANPKGYVGAWKIDEQIAGNLGILKMMELEDSGAKHILHHGLPKYVKQTKHQLHRWLHRTIGLDEEIAKMQSVQRYIRRRDNPVEFDRERTAVHKEFTRARTALHKREIKGKYSTASAYSTARGALQNIYSEQLKQLTGANILDPTAESILREGINQEFYGEIQRLNQLRDRKSMKQELKWADASGFLSLAEQDALFHIRQHSEKLQHHDSVLAADIGDIRPAEQQAKKVTTFLANDLAYASRDSIHSHLAKRLTKIGWSKGVAPTSSSGSDVKHEILDVIQGLEDPSTGIPSYKFFIIPQLEQERNAITGGNTTGVADTSALTQLLQQELAYAATDFSVAERQLDALRSFTPVLGQMVGSFAKGGVIPQTGYALVHRDETIIPDPEGPFGSQYGSYGGDVTVNPNVYLTLNGDLRMLEAFIDARIDERAPSVVNSSLGRRSRQLAAAPGR